MANYPFVPYSPDLTYVYFPSSTTHDLLVDDANHTLMAIFLPQAADRDYTRVQDHLISLYGGQRQYYQVLRCSPVRFLVSLPQYLSRETVLEDIRKWGELSGVNFYLHDHTLGWRQAPTSYRLYIRVLDYPAEFWHPKVFQHSCSGFWRNTVH